MRKLASLVVAVALATALAACGDDDDAPDAGADGASITKEAYVAQANAICAEGQAALSAALTELTAETSEEEFAAIVVEAIRGQVTELRALGYPEGDQEALDGMFSEAEALLAEIEADPSIALENDPFADVNAQLAEYGLTTCAE